MLTNLPYLVCSIHLILSPSSLPEGACDSQQLHGGCLLLLFLMSSAYHLVQCFGLHMPLWLQQQQTRLFLLDGTPPSLPPSPRVGECGQSFLPGLSLGCQPLRLLSCQLLWDWLCAHSRCVAGVPSDPCLILQASWPLCTVHSVPWRVAHGLSSGDCHEFIALIV